MTAGHMVLEEVQDEISRICDVAEPLRGDVHNWEVIGELS